MNHRSNVAAQSTKSLIIIVDIIQQENIPRY